MCIRDSGNILKNTSSRLSRHRSLSVSARDAIAYPSRSLRARNQAQNPPSRTHEDCFTLDVRNAAQNTRTRGPASCANHHQHTAYGSRVGMAGDETRSALGRFVTSLDLDAIEAPIIRGAPTLNHNEGGTSSSTSSPPLFLVPPLATT